MTLSPRKILTACVAATAVAAGAPAVASAATTHAGASILIHTDKGSVGECTLNSVAVRGDQTYGVTAGHCLNPEEFNGEQPVKITTGSGELLADAAGIADGGFVEDGGANPAAPDAGLNDLGWFRLDGSVDADATGVSSVAQTGTLLDPLLSGQRLEVGDQYPVGDSLVGGLVCKDGAISGRTCGPVLSVNSASQEVFALIPAIAGDSGSPLYVIGGDGKAHVLGALSNGTPVLFNVFDGTWSHQAEIGA
jgi:hypothetical protein